MIYVIEHLEPEIFLWCQIEYEHLSNAVGFKNLLFTNTSSKKLKKLGKVEEKSVLDLGLENCCLLDLNAEKTLSPEDKFDYLVFGGILGDNPPRGRTSQLNRIKHKRNLGRKQMSTDNAVMASKLIVEGKNFKDIKFIDNLEINTDENESVILPYRYLLINNKPFISKKLVDYLKKTDEI